MITRGTEERIMRIFMTAFATPVALLPMLIGDDR
jgi:Cu/Ag efflux pump CusA